MVAPGDHVHAAVKEKVRRMGQDAVSYSGIFAVADHGVDLLFPLEGGKGLPEKVAARLADHISDHHYSHRSAFRCQ